MTSMSPPHVANGMSDASPSADAMSARQAVVPKNVAFELLFMDAPQYRARLPMRVQIYPHDTTDSIVTTVKNFYGLYSGPTGSKGVSFEDKDGNTLIARYENFRNNMVVYVRVFEECSADSAAYSPSSYQAPSNGGHAYYAGEPYHHHHAQNSPHDTSRPASTSSRRRSPSPNTVRGLPNDPAFASGQLRRSRSVKARNGLALSQADAYSDNMNGYSSDEGAQSTTSKNKEQLGNTDISVENIVEGGRRKRAKFESSELPLFAPPQMPAATSNPSVSPARRIEHQRPSLPFAHPGQNPFSNPRPIQNTHQYTNGMQPGLFSAPSRNGAGMGSNSGVMPTPDPTVGSCMSEEDKDVAIQLMRLGDMSNISHGRTSASTLDDTFSGKADAASSTGATSDGESESESELPPARRQKLDSSGQFIYPSTEVQYGASYYAGSADIDTDDTKEVVIKSISKPKVASSVSKPSSNKTAKASRPANNPASKAKKLPPIPGAPVSPISAPPSRKQSIASTGAVPPLGDDEPDLSTKPRCQRCRKSKKGCDRQRPCGRCRDAGLTADQCISEDEGNGRKGRYGRHMGVPIKKDEVIVPGQPPALLPAAPIVGPPTVVADMSKKRKR